MKTAFVLLSVIAGSAAFAQEQKTFAINGSLNKIKDVADKVFLTYNDLQKTVTDSAEVRNGNYVFTGKMADPVMARLRIRFKPGADGKPVKAVPARDYMTIFLRPAVISITSTDSFVNAKLTGSPENDAFIEMNTMLKPENEVYSRFGADYNKARAENDIVAKKVAETHLDSMDKVIRNLYGDYVKKHPRSPIAFMALTQYAGWDINVEEIDPLLQALPEEQKNYNITRNLAHMVNTARKTGIGQLAMDFTQNDTLGKPVKLSSFKGRYVLVDFWASWCGPCREENPNVVKAYQAYKSKNFHIIGVSLDRPDAKEKWMEAIHKDNLTWTHVSDLKFWENEVAKQYGIQAIPQNLLIDPTGKIIAKNLNGENLEKKLAEIYRN